MSCLCGQCRCLQLGLSARAILYGGNDHPHDPGDFNRCLKVSWDTPEHMRDRSPHWSALVDHWVELRDLLESERSRDDGRAPATYKRMQELLRPVRRAS